MPCAGDSHDGTFVGSFSSISSRSHRTTGPAFETVVASYASRVLKRKSPPESVIDSNVGPYVSSILHAALGSETDIGSQINLALAETVPEYHCVMELLEENCNMSEEDAKSALQSIAKAIVTGEFEDDEVRTNSYGGFSGGNAFGGMVGKYRSLSLGSENDYAGGGGGGRFRSVSMGNYDDHKRNVNTGASIYFNEMPSESKRRSSLAHLIDTSMIKEEPSFLFEDDSMSHNSFSKLNANATTEEKDNNQTVLEPSFLFTPLKADRLLPEGLLGFMDDPSTPSTNQKLPLPFESSHVPNTLSLEGLHAISASPIKPEPLATSPPKTPIDAIRKDNITKDKTALVEKTQLQSNTTRQGNKKKKVKKKDMDLAASLFSRPRSRSIHDVVEKAQKLKAMTGVSMINNLSNNYNYTSAVKSKQLDSAVQILMAMNFDLCGDAAYEAALVSNADVNVAQHVVDGAVAAPPVCRHLLHDGCYRSDCQFSHDVDGHTCLFWLRGRCKVNTCKFMHGFSEKLLDGIDVEALTALSQSNPAMGIQTANLVQHNMNAQFTFHPSNHVSPSNQSGTNSQIPMKSYGSSEKSTQEHNTKDTPRKIAYRERSQSLPNSTFSFASIASKGYSKKLSFGTNCASGSNDTNNNDHKETKTVRIPQNLWNPFHNRTSNAFHISDPLARYKEVNSSVRRNDVIDLHFQSIKTFPVVLSTVLPGKLRDQHEVWIVTGSGHHVNSNSHQKGGGILENAVIEWLTSNNYIVSKGLDKNDHGGACLVRRRNR